MAGASIKQRKYLLCVVLLTIATPRIHLLGNVVEQTAWVIGLGE